MAVSDLGMVVARESVWSRVRGRLRRPQGGTHHSFWWHVGHWFGRGRWIGLLALLGLFMLRAWDPLPVESLRHRTFDLYQRIEPRPFPENPPTIIVDLDEESLAEIGQWPWPRTIVAQMLQKLTELGAASVGFDIVFAEPDRMSPGAIADVIPQIDPETQTRLRQLQSNDAVFAAALKASRAVLGQSGFGRALEHSDERPPKKASISAVGPKGVDPKQFMPRFASMVRNIQILEDASPGRGLITVEPDKDGVVRRVPAALIVKGDIYPALSLEMLRVAVDPRRAVLIRTSDVGITEVAITKDLKVPTDPKGQTWVYYTSPDRERRYVSARDVIKGTVDPNKIKGRLVLIGTSATGLLDIRNTPLHPALPGVEVHANLLETILAKTNLSYPWDSQAREYSAVVVAGLLMVVLVPMIGAGLTLGLLVVMIGGLTGYSWYQFTEYRILVDLSYPVISTIFLYSLLTYANYAKTAAERKQVRGAFAQYLSPALLEQLAENPSLMKLGGQKREMTMLFSDIRGFTTISEQFKTNPEGLTRLINRFLTPLTDAIMSRQGTIDKYMGDAIMAFWNAPLDVPEHAQRACDAALAMKALVPVINANLQKEAEAEGRAHHYLKVGIGINSGDVVVGNMGSDQRFDYSVLGDAVNLASRLEGQSKPYGVTIVIGEDGYKHATNYAALELDLIAVKGKTEAVRIYTIVGDPAVKASPEFQALAEKHAAAIAAYRAQRWDEALALIEACRTLDKWEMGEFYDVYVERIAEFKSDSPGPNWDGVYVAKSK